jgi:hypothetical protein
LSTVGRGLRLAPRVVAAQRRVDRLVEDDVRAGQPVGEQRLGLRGQRRETVGSARGCVNRR